MERWVSRVERVERVDEGVFGEWVSLGRVERVERVDGRWWPWRGGEMGGRVERVERVDEGVFGEAGRGQWF